MAKPDVMIDSKLVSVVTPVFNGEAHVSRLLDSILAQTYSNIEVILVDDGSTDDTVNVAMAYVPRFESRGWSLQIIQAPHKNASAAINAGLPHVTGEYLIWPDADDELLPDSVAKRVAFLENHPKFDCVRSLMEYVSEETGEPVPGWEPLGNLTAEELFWDILEERTFVCCGCYMLRTEDFFRIYPRKRIPEYDVGQNFQMLLPFLFLHRCPTIPEVLYRVYVRPDSHSRQTRSESEETLRYQSYEDLIDEIATLCKLTDNQCAMDRIELWKVLRRRHLARRYLHIGKLFRSEWASVRLRLRLLRHRSTGLDACQPAR